MNLNEIARIILLVGIFIAIYYGTWMITMKRNIKKILKLFEEKDALTAETGASIEELGLQKKDLLKRMVSKKDNRIHAMKLLVEAGAVINTSSGGYYLNKEKLAEMGKSGNFMARFIIPNLED